MNLPFGVNKLKNRIKDRLIRRRARTDAPHTQTYTGILEVLPSLSWQEREAILWELNRQLAESSESIAYAEKIFQEFAARYREQGGRLERARVVELGPGVNLATGLLFALAGAAQYTAVDALAAFPERPIEFYRNLVEVLKLRPLMAGRGSLTDEEIASILTVDEAVRWNPDRVRYLTPVRAEEMPLPDNSFDYVFSNASFEHFEEPQKVIRKIRDVLRPGALTIHVIDLRDHLDFTKPREFLKVGRQEYRYNSPYGTNRWRASDFKRGFEAVGLRIRSITTTAHLPFAEGEYEALHEDLRRDYTREDLEILGILVVAEKP